jgi:hypothetical protein
MEAVYAGIDISKQWLDVGLWPGAETFRLSNDASGVAELAERLRAVRARWCWSLPADGRCWPPASCMPQA